MFMHYTFVFLKSGMLNLKKKLKEFKCLCTIFLKSGMLN